MMNSKKKQSNKKIASKDLNENQTSIESELLPESSQKKWLSDFLDKILKKIKAHLTIAIITLLLTFAAFVSGLFFGMNDYMSKRRDAERDIEFLIGKIPIKEQKDIIIFLETGPFSILKKKETVGEQIISTYTKINPSRNQIGMYFSLMNNGSVEVKDIDVQLFLNNSDSIFLKSKIPSYNDSSLKVKRLVQNSFNEELCSSVYYKIENLWANSNLNLPEFFNIISTTFSASKDIDSCVANLILVCQGSGLDQTIYKNINIHFLFHNNPKKYILQSLASNKARIIKMAINKTIILKEKNVFKLEKDSTYTNDLLYEDFILNYKYSIFSNPQIELLNNANEVVDIIDIK